MRVCSAGYDGRESTIDDGNGTLNPGRMLASTLRGGHPLQAGESHEQHMRMCVMLPTQHDATVVLVLDVDSIMWHPMRVCRSEEASTTV